SDDLHTDEKFFKLGEYDEATYELSYKHSSFGFDGWEELEDATSKYSIFARNRYLPRFAFDRFTYDDGKYSCASFVSNNGTYSNIVIEFEDNKLVSYSYKYVETGYEGDVSCTVLQIGDVVVNNPFKNLINEEIFNSYFGSYEESLMNLNITFKDQSEGGIEVAMSDGMTAMYSSKNNSSHFYKATSYDEKENILYFDMAQAINIELQEWTSPVANYMSYESYRNSIAIPYFDFDDFTYNEETCSYDADLIVLSSDISYKDISIIFEDNKLKSYKFTTVYPLQEVNHDYIVKSEGKCMVVNPNENKVTSKTFDSYFGTYNDSLSKLNIKFDYEEKSSVSLFNGEININNNEVSTETHSSSSDKKKYYSFKLNDEGEIIYDKASIDVDGDEWSDLVRNNLSYNEFRNYIYFPRFNFDEFTYDELTKSYTAENISLSDELVYKNVSIKFENNKLVSLEYIFKSNALEFEIKCNNFTFNDAEIVRPTYANMVCAGTFNEYFGLTPETFNNLNITLKYDYSVYKGTLEYDDGLRLDTYVRKGNTNQDQEIYYITEVGETVKFHYYVKTDESWSYNNIQSSSFERFMLEFMYMPVVDYYQFTYDEETSCYVASNLSTNAGNISNFKIKFVDGKLDSYSFTHKDTEYKIEEVTNIGTTEVIDPRASIEE
ncbi:MAG: hypothetical protein K5892_01780, partial [Acholeplasmatales bacterium]|nr:hypothetical protein [Acholeplasmatales bacterium]